MKKIILQPGFEFIFALSLIAILGLPPVLLAQTRKDLEIKIENGDTIINGKNLKELSAQDRKEALSDINHLGSISGNREGNIGQRYFYKRKDSTGVKREEFVEFRKRKGPHNGERQPLIGMEQMSIDSSGQPMDERPGMRKMDRTFTFKYRNNNEMPGMNEPATLEFNRLGRMPFGFERRNSQNFNYVNTDNQGMSTHISFHVSEPGNDDLQKITGIEGAKLELSDLTLVPEFTTGKTVLMFRLASRPKTVAEVNLKDGDGKLLWSEKLSGGNFSKSFNLPLNGIYYLHVKQGGSMAVKKIVKEE